MLFHVRSATLVTELRANEQFLGAVTGAAALPCVAAELHCRWQ